MFNTITQLFIALSLFSCTKNSASIQSCNSQNEDKIVIQKERVPHEYGAWYCPDNLFGFPAVNIKDWEKVPAISHRLPTEEECKSGESLIHVDTSKYPDAEVIAMKLPALATYYSEQTRRKEYVIVIQAISIGEDSVVGFRFINGGNGSSHLDEVTFLNEKQIAQIPDAKFVTIDVELENSVDVVWEILTDPKHHKDLQPLGRFTYGNLPQSGGNVNYYYPNHGRITSAWSGKLYGIQYIQNIYQNYCEKFMVIPPEDDKKTVTLKVVAGPFADDYEQQKEELNEWMRKVKDLLDC